MKTTESIPVFLSADNNYAPYMVTLMISIMENTESKINFYIIDAGLSNLTKQIIKNIQKKYNFSLEFIDAEKYRHYFPMPASPSGHITRASSDRFLIPYMKPELDRAIVLDVDMIAMGDIKTLWDTDLEGKLLGAVPVYCFMDINSIYEAVREVGLNPSHYYLNMGTVVLDCKQWREKNMCEQISKIKINFDTQKYHNWDELLLNLTLEVNNYKIIDPKFNMAVSHISYYQQGKPYAHMKVIEEHFKLTKEYKLNDFIFIHFAMPHVKPWRNRMYYYSPIGRWIEIPGFKEFWYYMQKTPFFESEKISFQDMQVGGLYDLGYTNSKEQSLAYANRLRKYEKYKLLTKLTMGLVPKFKKLRNKYAV